MIRQSIALVMLAALLGCAEARDSDGASESTPATALPALADLPEGWNLLRPGGDTVCAQGTEFVFFARHGAADKLLVYLQGGGACWNLDTCDPQGDPTYKMAAGEGDNPEFRGGIFDLDDPENPLADYTMVMVPYCTGDVHIGDRQSSYEDPDTGRVVTVEHRGWSNAGAVLDWTFANVEAPREVVVAGTSAGSIPSPLYGQIVAARYPEARVTALGDASGAYRREATSDAPTFETWGTLAALHDVPGYAAAGDEDMSFSGFYITAAQQRPNLRLRQYDAANDEVQGFFLSQAGTDRPDVHGLLQAERAVIRQSVPGFRAFTAGGPTHGILTDSRFYTYEVDGRRFRDWFADAIGPGEVEDVDCADCARAELHPPAEAVAVLERAGELLADEAAWKREEDGRCDDDLREERYTLACAVAAAALQLETSPGTAREELAYVVAESRRAPYAELLAAFNGDEATEHGEVLAALDRATSNLREHDHD